MIFLDSVLYQLEMKEMKGNCICLCAPHWIPTLPHQPLNRPSNMMLGEGGNVWITSITLDLERT